jgi:hypothetical protein
VLAAGVLESGSSAACSADDAAIQAMATSGNRANRLKAGLQLNGRLKAGLQQASGDGPRVMGMMLSYRGI